MRSPQHPVYFLHVCQSEASVVLRHLMLRFVSYLMLFAVLLTSGCSVAPDLEVSREFQEAEAAFVEAQSSEDFVRVAAMYQEILDSGFRSGSVFYNQGNAWMQAGQIGRAIASYRQASRQLPRDPYLKANLNLALQKAASPTQETSVIDYVFFWQDSLSYLEKAQLVTFLLAALLALNLFRQAGWHRKLLYRIGLVVSLFSVLAAASLFRDWYNYDHTRHGVIVSDEVVARKGGSENYDSAFKQPLKDGAEFTVIQERNGWLNVQFSSGEAWVPERDAVTW